jgi:polyhydroxybutyrate depolymerase
MLDKVASEYAADKSRIYAAGLSGGGFMALRVGCTMADRVAAVAAVGAAMPKSMTCLPSRSMPVLMINGTSDPVVRYDGSSRGHALSYPTLSAEDSAKSWSKLDGCTSKPSRTKIRPRVKGGMQTRVDTYDGCRQGAQVVLYSIKGAGNTWPGG